MLRLIRAGVNRPGDISRAVEELTTKVLNERLSQLVKFDIIEKIAYPEIPPRVEYELTEFGHRFVCLLDMIDNLKADRQSLT